MQILRSTLLAKTVLIGAILLSGVCASFSQEDDEAAPEATPEPTAEAATEEETEATSEPETASTPEPTPAVEEGMPPLIPEARSIPGVPDTVLAKVDVFFALLSRGRIDQAYDSLVSGTVIEAKPADVEVLKKKTREAQALFGKITGHDIADVKPVGDRLIRVTSLSFGENYPLRWRFYFYQSKGEWRLIDIRVDDRLMDLFNETEPAAAR